MPRPSSTALPVAYVVLRILLVLNWIYGACIFALLLLTPNRDWIISAPSANTRARTKVRITASQPLVEKPASRCTGCSVVDIAWPMPPITMLSS